MSSPFQLPLGSGGRGESQPFARYGLADNPFPQSGVESGALYLSHMHADAQRVNAWIQSVCARGDENRGPIHPLAVYGSLGVGKTHLLVSLQRGLESDPDARTPVLRRALSEEGMTRLTLASLLLRHLPFSSVAEDPAMELLRRVIGEAQSSQSKRKALLEVLQGGSPLRAPCETLLRNDFAGDGVLWLSRWLRREYTTPAQRAKLGLSGVLEGEGQAIRAMADMLRLARRADLVRVWFVMIDQLEELWREGVVTPSRRARFLTDLRFLVDQALEGAPIALLLAWNTETAVGRFIRDQQIADQMKRDYLALWERLGEPINLPPLNPGDVWPFACTYLEKAGIHEDSSDERHRQLWDRLKGECDSVVSDSQARAGAHELLAPRHVLAAWRKTAESIALPS